MICPRTNRVVDMVHCATCDFIINCKEFYMWYLEHKKKYNGFLFSTINKFPEKYELGGVMKEKNKKTENFIIVFDGKKMIKSIPKSKVQKMTPEDLLELKNKKLIEATPKELELIYQIKIKSKPWDGKLSAKAKK